MDQQHNKSEWGRKWHHVFGQCYLPTGEVKPNSEYSKHADPFNISDAAIHFSKSRLQ